MSDLNRLRVVVAGAGALGSVVALQLARRGAQVVLADPAPQGANASSVAAGMLAPVFETLLDPASADHFPILSHGRDAWRPLIHSLSPALVLDRSGALMRVENLAKGEIMAARISALGAEARLMDAGASRDLAPGLAGEGVFLFTPDDWRLDPLAVLAALRSGLLALGGRFMPAGVVSFDQSLVRFDDGQAWAADVVVLATGYAAAGWPEAMGGAQLTPIKGQILRFGGAGHDRGPVLRGEGVYVAPSADSLIVGATMEIGRSDLDVDFQAVERLRAAGSSFLPGLAALSPVVSVGVRAATADGLPLVGPSRQPGVILARGARRNGWLLAPTVAEIIVEHLMERPPSIAAKRFDPARFG